MRNTRSQQALEVRVAAAELAASRPTPRHFANGDEQKFRRPKDPSVPSYLASFNNSIASNPVAAGDVPGLQAMLLGAAPANAREQAIFNVADGFGRVAGAVLAHEIGHSLGLLHSSPSQGSGDIMNASLSVGPSITYAFNPGHWTQLQSNLPGPNR